MKNKSQIGVGSFVTHKSKYGMHNAIGRVIAEAGTKYGRRYVWVNYTVRDTNKTFNSAFWDQVLIPTTKTSVVRPGTIPIQSSLA